MLIIMAFFIHFSRKRCILGNVPQKGLVPQLLVLLIRSQFFFFFFFFLIFIGAIVLNHFTFLPKKMFKPSNILSKRFQISLCYKKLYYFQTLSQVKMWNENHSNFVKIKLINFRTFKFRTFKCFDFADCL